MSSLNSLGPLFAPNRANPRITFPLATISDLQAGLSALSLSSITELPKKFDWRDNGLLPPSNQGTCGNCWAQSSTNALTDKFRVLTEGAFPDLELDQLVLTMCAKNPNLNGCNGGMPFYAGKYLESRGAIQGGDSKTCKGVIVPKWKDYYDTVQAKIKQFRSTNPNATPQQVQDVTSGLFTYDCNLIKDCEFNFKAEANSTKALTVAKKDGTVDPKATVDNIKTAIMNTGPVVGVFQVYNDFMIGGGVLHKEDGTPYKWDATNGVYIPGSYKSDLDKLFEIQPANIQQQITPMKEWSSPAQGGGAYHAVELVGWDVDPKFGEYWIIKNSWGDKWADNGYWKHAMWTPERPNTCMMDVPGSYSETGGLGGCITFSISESYMKKKGDGGGGGDQKKSDGSNKKKSDDHPAIKKVKKGQSMFDNYYVKSLGIILLVVLIVAILYGIYYYISTREEVKEAVSVVSEVKAVAKEVKAVTDKARQSGDGITPGASSKIAEMAKRILGSQAVGSAVGGVPAVGPVAPVVPAVVAQAKQAVAPVVAQAKQEVAQAKQEVVQAVAQQAQQAVAQVAQQAQQVAQQVAQDAKQSTAMINNVSEKANEALHKVEVAGAKVIQQATNAMKELEKEGAKVAQRVKEIALAREPARESAPKKDAHPVCDPVRSVQAVLAHVDEPPTHVPGRGKYNQ